LRPIKAGHPATVNRMVYVDGKLHKLPSSLGSLLKVQPPFSRPLFLAGLRDLMTGQKKCEDESIYDFVSRRLGPELAQFAIDPMVRGICAGDARSISANSFVAGPMFRLEQEYGGIFKGLFMRKLLGKVSKFLIFIMAGRQ
jgi:oxygen-dependent protoporphyrinogen oxidase